jgi:hypothetical protein
MSKEKITEAIKKYGNDVFCARMDILIAASEMQQVLEDWLHTLYGLKRGLVVNLDSHGERKYVIQSFEVSPNQLRHFYNTSAIDDIQDYISNIPAKLTCIDETVDAYRRLWPIITHVSNIKLISKVD